MPTDNDSHLQDAMVSWFLHPAIASAEPRGMPIYPPEYAEAAALAERQLVVIHKEPAAWFVRYPTEVAPTPSRE